MSFYYISLQDKPTDSNIYFSSSYDMAKNSTCMH